MGVKFSTVYSTRAFAYANEVRAVIKCDDSSRWLLGGGPIIWKYNSTRINLSTFALRLLTHFWHLKRLRLSAGKFCCELRVAGGRATLTYSSSSLTSSPLLCFALLSFQRVFCGGIGLHHRPFLYVSMSNELQSNCYLNVKLVILLYTTFGLTHKIYNTHIRVPNTSINSRILNTAIAILSELLAFPVVLTKTKHEEAEERRGEERRGEERSSLFHFMTCLRQALMVDMKCNAMQCNEMKWFSIITSLNVC